MAAGNFSNSFWRQRAATRFVLLVLLQLQGPASGMAAEAAGGAGNNVPHVGSGSTAQVRSTAAATNSATPWLAAVRHYIALREYRASENATGLQAPSRRHAFRTYFEPTGIRVVDRVAEGSPELLALRLEGLGRVDSLAPVAPGVVATDGARVEIRRTSLTEWYVNSPDGLEQGFTLPERIAGEGPVVLELLLEGAGASVAGDGVRIATATGRRLAYGKLKAVDARGNSLPVELRLASASRLQLQVNDTGAVYPVVIDPLLTDIADTWLESDQPGALFGFSVAGAGDVNGDGYDDVIVGAWRYDAGEQDEGAAFIFPGSAAGIADATPASAPTMIEGDQAGAELGENVAGAGDVNGDGYDDVIVGAWHYDSGEIDEGAAFIFHGSATGIAHGTPATANTRLEADQASAEMGFSVAGAGDVNGDGYDDVIVGAGLYDAAETDEGAAFIFHGSATGIADAGPDTAHTRITGEQAGARLGLSDAAGDVNGDGYDDVIVGALDLDAGETDEGAAFVFLGGAAGIADASPATAHARFEGDQAQAWMGVSVSGAGDVNGDGYDDVIVGARRYDLEESDEGAAFVFYGSAAGIADGNPATARTRLTGDQAGAWMGHSVADAGDINGDGYDDVIVAASRYDAGEPDTGAVYVFLGSASGIGDAGPGDAYAVFEADQPKAHMGYGAAGAGDVNGDGFDDIVVGIYHYDCGQKNEGAAFVYLGGRADAGGVSGSHNAVQRAGCRYIPEKRAYSRKRLAAAALLVLGGAGLLVLLLRRRARSGTPSP